jgi:hypothetical protein
MEPTHGNLLPKGALPSFCFSFHSDTLEAKIKERKSFEDYDRSNPSTFPFITLAKLN